ncbi:MAG: class D beta-lactamase [Flammeovirgaceae bacterium]|nr:class D beta-lactamase [Flammeovirgaceae bacterium]
MKKYLVISVLAFFISCTEKKGNPDNKEKEVVEREISKPEFQEILDSSKIKGAIVIYDLQNDRYFSNDFSWAKKGNLPASTFKVANSIIALETGVVENDSTLFKWNGEKRSLKNWEQDLILRDAFHYSCLPCYQEVAREIGEERMNEHLDKFKYGQMKVDAENIDMFWLEGRSRISPFQQIDFLKRFYLSELPIAKRTEEIMKRMMVMEENDKYILSGKTGWSISDGQDNGWFVGYIESGSKTYFFAANVEPAEHFDMDKFAMIRKEVVYKAFEIMGIINQVK